MMKKEDYEVTVKNDTGRAVSAWRLLREEGLLQDIAGLNGGAVILVKQDEKGVVTVKVKKKVKR